MKTDYPIIDLHTHILPGLDDGADNLETALQMAQIAAQDGITLMAATPHVMRGVYDNSKEKIIQMSRELNRQLADAGINLTLLPGAEYYLEGDLPRKLAAGELLTINEAGRYLLVELPAGMVPDYTGRVLYEIQLQGITPILAHPERNSGFARDPQLLQNFIERGILAQITSGSITGLFGRAVQKTAISFVQSGYAHIIASDAHSAHKKSGRGPILSEAIAQIEHTFGADYALLLTSENPRRIIEGQNIQPTPIKNRKKENIWQKIFSKKERNII